MNMCQLVDFLCNGQRVWDILVILLTTLSGSLDCRYKRSMFIWYVNKLISKLGGWYFVCDRELCCLCLVLLRFVWMCEWCISIQVCIVAVYLCAIQCVVTSDWGLFICLWQRSQIQMTEVCLFVCVVGPGFDRERRPTCPKNGIGPPSLGAGIW